MIGTGAAMYFQDFRLDILVKYGISQIDFLRASAIVHNALGLGVTALFFVHLYMSIFAIKGAVHSIITGYKEEEEVEVLHSSYYKKLKEKKKYKTSLLILGGSFFISLNMQILHI